MFVAGLMVGRTPEYVGKKIEAREVKLAVLAIAVLPLVHPRLHRARRRCCRAGLAGPLNKGPHGFTRDPLRLHQRGREQRLGLRRADRATRPSTTALLGVAMWVGRFFVIVPMLAIAGSLAAKKHTPDGAGLVPDHRRRCGSGCWSGSS